MVTNTIARSALEVQRQQVSESGRNLSDEACDMPRSFFERIFYNPGPLMLGFRRWLPWFFFCGWFAAMFLAPALQAGMDWEELQEIWDRWQTLNASLFALAASIVLFAVTQYREEKQRDRNLTAAKAYLPEALSEITAYLRASAKESVLHSRGNGVPNPMPVDEQLVHYRDAFRECIRHAVPEEGRFLAWVLQALQVEISRHREFVRNVTQGQGPIDELDAVSLLSRLSSIAELHIVIDRLYGYARETALLNSGVYTMDEFVTAYLNCGLDPHTIATRTGSLFEYTQCLIGSRRPGSWRSE